MKLVLCILCLFVTEAAAQESTAQKQSRGRQIYIQGTSRSGKDVLAYIGDASLEVPASTIPCAGCHGLDGRGKPEGGVNPSNVTWEFLTKPYGLKHASGRQHPPYTERALELAITRGTDPAGNKLLPVMPRYVMTREDLADLIAYLQLLGKEGEPGVTETKIVIGTLAPSSGVLADFGRVSTAVTNALFEEVNSQGGIFGRRLELKIIETAETPSATRAKVEPVLKERQVFAMSGAIVAGSEKELMSLFSQNETPLIGPFSLYPQTGFPLNRHVFYLLSGIEGQARSLINFIAQKPQFKNSNIAVIYSRNEFNADAVEAIKDQRKKKESKLPAVVEYAAGGFDAADAAREARQGSAEIVFFLGNADESLAFMREAEKLNWFPTVLGSGGIGSGILTAPVGFDRKIFLSFPMSPEDQTVDGIKEFRTLAAKYNLSPTHLTAQISAYVAAKVLVEAIRRSGKDLSREKLIQMIEALHQYSTGLSPPMTYGPNRRIGAMGAYVVTIDLKEKKFVPVGDWIESN